MHVLTSQRHDEGGLTNKIASLIIFMHALSDHIFSIVFQFPFWDGTIVPLSSTESITLGKQPVNRKLQKVEKIFIELGCL